MIAIMANKIRAANKGMRSHRYQAHTEEICCSEAEVRGILDLRGIKLTKLPLRKVRRVPAA